MEHFIITDESCDLTKDIRWEGNTLEKKIEEWLEEQGDLLEAENLLFFTRPASLT